MATDPVCKMEVEPTKAAAKAEYAGQTYYFCSGACHQAFVAEPQKYAVRAPDGGGQTHGGSHHHGDK
ncbi:MAG: YHS domain-containing protein [Sulfuricella sp.]